MFHFDVPKDCNIFPDQLILFISNIIKRFYVLKRRTHPGIHFPYNRWFYSEDHTDDPAPSKWMDSLDSGADDG